MQIFKESMKIFDNLGIKYEIKKHQSPVYTCEDAAKERGVVLAQVLKCMVGKDSEGNIYAMLLPGDRLLKIKKVRQIAQGANISLAPTEELAKLGLEVGAISPVQLLGRAKFYMDKTVLNEEYITISSGAADAGVMLKTKDLAGVIKPDLCDIIGGHTV